MDITRQLSPLFHIFLLCLSSLTLSQSAIVCNAQDKQALLQIKNQFQNSSAFSTWDPKTDCCSWRFVQCNSDLWPDRVNILFFDDVNDIAGPIPPAVGNLPYLVVLQFSKLPNLIGPIPATITKLSNLQVLVIKQNKKLTGSIPDFLSEMKSVREMDLSFNSFSGTIPSFLSILPNLYSLDLSSNKLTGSIPESFGSFKPGLDLKVMNNQLSGMIPRSLGKANLSGLDVSGNRFTGDASFMFTGDRLGDISLRQNQFKFDFTNVNLPQGLRTIDIAHNQIYGSIPRNIGQLPVLQSVDFSYNQLCGQIPTGLKQFDPSRFANNKCLCGVPLPPCK